MTKPTERDHQLQERAFLATEYKALKQAVLLSIATARGQGWQAGSDAWRSWLDTNIPAWDAVAGIDLTTLPKASK